MAVFPSDSIRTKNWGSEVLTDSDLEAQLDLLHAYFQAALNATTGHSHDGTGNQGPKLAYGAVTTTFGNGFTTVTAASGDYLLVASDVSDSNTTKKALVSDIITASTFVPSVTNALSGSTIQTLYDVSGTVDSTTTALPYDTSEPTIGEGKATDLSVTITPSHTNNTIEVSASVLIGSGSGSPYAVVALFEDNTCVAYQAVVSSGLGSAVLFYRKAGSVGTSAITYTIRFGPGTGGNTAVYNGDLSGNVLGGTVTKSYIKVQEIKA